jgi:hypothetical protein
MQALPAPSFWPEGVDPEPSTPLVAIFNTLVDASADVFGSRGRLERTDKALQGVLERWPFGYLCALLRALAAERVRPPRQRAA